MLGILMLLTRHCLWPSVFSLVVAKSSDECIQFSAKSKQVKVDELLVKFVPLRTKVKQVPKLPEIMSLIPDNTLFSIAHSPNKTFRVPWPDDSSPLGLRRVDTFNVNLPWSAIKNIMDVVAHRHHHPAFPLPPGFDHEFHDDLGFGMEKLNMKHLYEHPEYGIYIAGDKNDAVQSLTRDGAPLARLTKRMLTWIMKNYSRASPYDIHYDAHIWFSGGGTTMAPHIDDSDNWHCQVAGTKKITLWSPSDAENLYPVQFNFPGDKHYTTLVLRASGKLEQNPVPFEKMDPKIHSAVNMDSPDFQRFPKFNKARPVQCDMEPGMCMWLPGGWWHYVTSPPGEINLGINYWMPEGNAQKRPQWNDLQDAMNTSMIYLRKLASAKAAGSSSTPSRDEEL